MKKTLYFFFILISFCGYAQNGPNAFDENNSDNTFNKINTTKDNETEGKHETGYGAGDPDPAGGNPADPTPIDDYIPLLVITAVGIIVYHTHQKKKTLSNKTSK